MDMNIDPNESLLGVFKGVSIQENGEKIISTFVVTDEYIYFQDLKIPYESVTKFTISGNNYGVSFKEGNRSDMFSWVIENEDFGELVRTLTEYYSQDLNESKKQELEYKIAELIVEREKQTENDLIEEKSQLIEPVIEPTPVKFTVTNKKKRTPKKKKGKKKTQKKKISTVTKTQKTKKKKSNVKVKPVKGKKRKTKRKIHKKKYVRKEVERKELEDSFLNNQIVEEEDEDEESFESLKDSGKTGTSSEKKSSVNKKKKETEKEEDNTDLDHYSEINKNLLLSVRNTLKEVRKMFIATIKKMEEKSFLKEKKLQSEKDNIVPLTREKIEREYQEKIKKNKKRYNLIIKEMSKQFEEELLNQQTKVITDMKEHFEGELSIRRKEGDKTIGSVVQKHADEKSEYLILKGRVMAMKNLIEYQEITLKRQAEEVKRLKKMNQEIVRKHSTAHLDFSLLQHHFLRCQSALNELTLEIAKLRLELSNRQKEKKVAEHALVPYINRVKFVENRLEKKEHEVKMIQHYFTESLEFREKMNKNNRWYKERYQLLRQTIDDLTEKLSNQKIRTKKYEKIVATIKKQKSEIKQKQVSTLLTMNDL